ncbi:MAG: hypothetical protein NTV59_08090 [Chloroflexi bacterium]|nr:hypothetical protein [Chloroflexota bacterium]
MQNAIWWCTITLQEVPHQPRGHNQGRHIGLPLRHLIIGQQRYISLKERRLGFV